MSEEVDRNAVSDFDYHVPPEVDGKISSIAEGFRATNAAGIFSGLVNRVVGLMFSNGIRVVGTCVGFDDKNVYLVDLESEQRVSVPLVAIQHVVY